MQIIINPGSGPVKDADEKKARENIRHLITDSKVKSVAVVRLKKRDPGDGRFSFLLWKDTRCVLVEMPGIPLHQVRYVGSEGQNIWDYPRLYVDGSSWVWNIAAEIISDILSNKDYKDLETKVEELEAKIGA